jgi:hypothetical protein
VRSPLPPPPQKVFWLESPDAALATVTEVEDCTHLTGGGGQELRANVDRDPDRAGSGGVPHAQIALARLARPRPDDDAPTLNLPLIDQDKALRFLFFAT